MSTVNALIIKNGTILFARHHYRKIIEILESRLKPGEMLDGGYILVDLDKKILFDCQDCFSLMDIKKGEIKRKLKQMNIYFCPK